MGEIIQNSLRDLQIKLVVFIEIFLDVEKTKFQMAFSLSFAFPYKSQPNLISLEDKLFGLNLPAFKGTGPNLIEVHRNISQEQYKS